MNLAIIFAAGSGSRMGKTILPKPFLTVKDVPILIRTLSVFDKNSLIDRIILVVNNDYIEYSKDLINQFCLTKVEDVISGGKTGQESIYNGLLFAKKKYGGKNIVILNDGVRPFIKDQLIRELIDCTINNGNAIAAVSAVETVAILENNITIPNRENCYFLKAPQCFILDELILCHEQAIKDGLLFVDSASMVNFYGYQLNLIMTDAFNIKITTQADLILAKELMENKTIE